MVDNIRNIRGLVLSANEVKQLTGWPDAMVEDYLNILDSLISLAESIDDSDTDTSDIEQSIASLNGSVSVNTALINQVLTSLNARIDETDEGLANALQNLFEIASRIGRIEVINNRLQEVIENLNDLSQSHFSTTATVSQLNGRSDRQSRRLDDIEQLLYI